MKLRLRHTKVGKIRFTSHRDTARHWERAVRKAGLSVAYSAGFTPRPKMSFGLALPTGAESLAEYLDIELAAGYTADLDALCGVDRRGPGARHDRGDRFADEAHDVAGEPWPHDRQREHRRDVGVADELEAEIVEGEHAEHVGGRARRVEPWVRHRAVGERREDARLTAHGLVAVRAGVRGWTPQHELATVALANYDARVRFQTRAARGNAKRALALLDKLDAAER